MPSPPPHSLLPRKYPLQYPSLIVSALSAHRSVLPLPADVPPRWRDAYRGDDNDAEETVVKVSMPNEQAALAVRAPLRGHLLAQ